MNWRRAVCILIGHKWDPWYPAAAEVGNSFLKAKVRHCPRCDTYEGALI